MSLFIAHISNLRSVSVSFKSFKTVYCFSIWRVDYFLALLYLVSSEVSTGTNRSCPSSVGRRSSSGSVQLLASASRGLHCIAIATAAVGIAIAADIAGCIDSVHCYRHLAGVVFQGCRLWVTWHREWDRCPLLSQVQRVDIRHND